MKKIRIFLMLSLAFSMLTTIAQVSPASVKAKGTMNRDAGYGCLPTSQYSQLPSPLTNGWYADDAYLYTRAGDDFTVSGSFTSMRFWGTNFLGCPSGATQAFIIKFYQRNPGNPAIPGPEVFSFNVTTVPQPIYFFLSTDYQVDVTFPGTVTLLDGWVSLTRINPDDGCNFTWYGGGTGNSVSYNSGTNTWEPQGSQLAFCLGGEGIPVTPVSNWALIIGVILIGTFVIFRFRRLV